MADDFAIKSEMVPCFEWYCKSQVDIDRHQQEVV